MSTTTSQVPAVFSGVGVALVTLFDVGGGLDAEATADLAGRLVEAGMQAVLVAGSTGEAYALDEGERRLLLTAVRRVVPDDVALLAGTGAPSGRQAARLTAQARDAGADAALVLSPVLSGDPRPYFATVAEAVTDLPLLAYHIPAMTPPGITLDHLRDLPVVGIKDSTGDANRLLAELTTYDGDTYVGSAALLSMAGPLGGAGAILALANAHPEDCVAAFAGDTDAQIRLAGPFFATSPFPQAIKDQTADRWGTARTARMG